MPTLRAGTSARKKDGMARVLAKIHAGRPKDGAETGTIDVTRTNKDILSRVRYVLKTGIRPIDDPIGGIPFGRITEIYGPEGGGKTAMVIRCAVQGNLKNIYEVLDDGTLKKIKSGDFDVNILYVDNEQSLTDDEKIEVDGHRLDVVLARCDTVDQLFKMIDLTIDTLEDYEKECEKPQLIIIIVDTIAGTSSKEELTQEWGKQDYNRQPKELRKGFRGLMRRLHRRNVAVICTNQISDSFKPKQNKKGRTFVPQDEDFNTFGGRALKFYSRLRIFLYKLRNFKLTKKSRFPAGFVSGFTTTKNGQRMPNREGRFVLLYQGGISEVHSLLEQLCLIKSIAEKNDKGHATFKFLQNGITPTTFGAPPVAPAEAGASLEADDRAESREPEEGEAKKKSYKFTGEPHEWPQYYIDHKDDIEALYEVFTKKMFTTEGAGGAEDADGDDDDDVDDFLKEDDDE